MARAKPLSSRPDQRRLTGQFPRPERLFLPGPRPHPLSRLQEGLNLVLRLHVPALQSATSVLSQDAYLLAEGVAGLPAHRPEVLVEAISQINEVPLLLPDDWQAQEAAPRPAPLALEVVPGEALSRDHPQGDTLAPQEVLEDSVE